VLLYVPAERYLGDVRFLAGGGRLRVRGREFIDDRAGDERADIVPVREILA
jgi:hypothetical protein